MSENKIKWQFQDESGDKLNQYRAVDVLTGETKIFNLFRNANITQQGTLLKAQTLNELINAINSAYLIELDSGDGVPKNLVNGGIFVTKNNQNGIYELKQYTNNNLVDLNLDTKYLGGKNASEYLTEITKNQVITALGYTPLQSETKRYQHNITLSYSGSVMRFNFINSKSSKYANFGLLTSDMLSTFGTNTIMAIGQSKKTKILMGLSIKKMSEAIIVGIDFQGNNIQDAINSATVTDFVVQI